MNFIKRFFTGMKENSPISDPAEVKSAPSGQNLTNTSTTVTSEPVKANENFSDEPPPPRTVLHAPALKDSLFPERSEDILIKAQPSQTGDQCLFTVNRVLMNNSSWYFDSFESAAESALAEALFSLDDVETVLVCESTVTVTRKDKTLVDWIPLAKEIGSAIRGILKEGNALIA